MKLLLVGAGGHGRVVADLAAETGAYSQIAFVDDRFPGVDKSGDWPIIATIADLPGVIRRFDDCVITMGDGARRLSLQNEVAALGFRSPVLVHRSAIVSRRAIVGPGTVIAAGAVINVGAKVGACCIINTGATVDHDCELEDAVHVCPGAHLAGNVKIGCRSWFGIGATAKQGIRIGRDVTVGAGAVCVSDIRDGLTVIGIPAKELHK